MAEATTIGRRIQSVRKRRGLSQADLAKISGVSVSLIRQLEQEQREDTRLETLRKLAVALRVPTAELAPTASAGAPSESDLQQWEPVRRALEGAYTNRSYDTAEFPTLAGVQAVFDSVKPSFRSGELTELIPTLAGLLADADALVEVSGNPEASARHLRSRVRQMTAWLMILTWQFDAADLAIRLALDDAPDVRSAVPLMDAECWRYIRQGDLAKAREVAIKWPTRLSRESSRRLRGMTSPPGG